MTYQEKIIVFLAYSLFLTSCAASTLPPIQPGAYPVASTAFFPDTTDEALLSRACSGDCDGKRALSPFDVLKNAPTIRRVSVAIAPPDPLLGDVLRSPYFLLYPTTHENTQPALKVLQGVLPHVQAVGGPLLLAESKIPFPLVLFSHGYRVHPFYDLPDLVMLASHGYVVACVLHGDGRFGTGVLGDWNPLLRLRALTLRAVIAALQQDREFAGRIDFGKVGIFGISLGGGAALDLLGATTAGSSRGPQAVTQAVFGESPALFPFLPRNGGNAGSVRGPIFGVVGSDDSLVTPVREILDSLLGPCWLLELPGQGHVPNDSSKRQIIATWMVHFFDATLKGSAEAASVLESGDTIQGAPASEFLIRKTKPEKSSDLTK